MKTSYLFFLFCLAFFMGCKKHDDNPAPNVHIDNPAIRLTYFYANAGNSDPASTPNPHLVNQAFSADGIHFGDEKNIFSYPNLVDPDLFKAGPGQYGLLVTDFSNGKLALAASSAPDGPFVLSGVLNSTNLTQAHTIRYNGLLKMFTTGIRVSDLDMSTGTVTNTRSVLTTQAVNASTGIVADPSVIKLDDGRYMMIFKYAQPGSPPVTHQTWMILSAGTDPTDYSGQQARLIRGGASVASAVRVGSKIYVYFVEQGNALGVAITENKGTSWTFHSVTLNGQLLQTAFDPTALPVDESYLE